MKIESTKKEDHVMYIKECKNRKKTETISNDSSYSAFVHHEHGTKEEPCNQPHKCMKVRVSV